MNHPGNETKLAYSIIFTARSYICKCIIVCVCMHLDVSVFRVAYYFSRTCIVYVLQFKHNDFYIYAVSEFDTKC
jgi:hypothetical protein